MNYVASDQVWHLVMETVNIKNVKHKPLLPDDTELWQRYSAAVMPELSQQLRPLRLSILITACWAGGAGCHSCRGRSRRDVSAVVTRVTTGQHYHCRLWCAVKVSVLTPL